MPTNADLLARRRAALPDAIATGLPFFAASADNATIVDVEGRRYIDLAAGIATLNTGHRHPRVVAAVKAQLEHFTHTAFQVIGYEGYVALCERLNAIAPVAGPAKSVLFNSGAEAVENAVKIARYATGRSGVIAFSGGFHGRTLLTMTMTGKVAPYKSGFGALPGDIHHALFPAAAQGIKTAEALASLDFLFRTSVAPETVAAIVIEPVQGEGGFHPAPTDFLRALRALCDQHGILLIADEVQTGFGRTGRMFAIEHSGVAPDLLTVAKSLGGGLPISGVIGRADIMDMVHVSGVGSTYGGAPMSCAAGLAVLDVIEEEGLIARADEIGAIIMRALEGFGASNDLLPIRNVRGLGAMMAFDIVADAIPGEAAGVTAKKIVQAAALRGLIILTCGPGGESIRLLPPLTIPFDQLHEGLALLGETLASLAKPALISAA